jgi:nicotinamidase-related amidase
MPTVETEPYVIEFDPRTAVLVIIDMQRDFVYPGWYVKRLRVTVVTIMGNPHLPPSGCFACTALRRTKQNTSS